MSLATTTKGTEILIGDGATPETFTRIPEVRSISVALILPKRATEDVSSFDTPSGSRDLLPTGAVSFDDVTIEVNWVPGHPIHEALITAATTGDITNFQLVEPSGNGKTTPFGAYVSYGSGALAPRAGLKCSFSLAPTNIGTRA